MNNKRSFSASKLFVILSGIMIMLTSFISINAISSNQKKQQAGVFKTSEPTASSTSKSTSTTTTSPLVFKSSPPSNLQPPASMSDFLYPNASIVSSTSTELHLTSLDNPKPITDWYKQKLSSLGYPVTNFIATSNNDNIENKLQSMGGKKIDVEISRGHGESKTDIEVKLN